ncbi:hypothetical protein [Cellulomonas sp. ES6]|nr:hypothetical protein [Cellulomonas sp. ES6]WHP16496.1 hypothetical protein P9841_12815 [Cellulomonas sp. ES6]
MSDSCCQSSPAETTAPTHECCGGTRCSGATADEHTTPNSTTTPVA